FGNVVVDTDPVVRTGDWPVDDGNRAPVRALVDKAECLAGSHLSHDFIAIFLRITPQAAALDPVANHIDQRRSGLHDLRRKPVHGAILVVANDEPAAGIEQDDALRHVVQRQRQQRGTGLPRLAPDQTIDGPQHGASRLKPPPPRSTYRTSIYAPLIN